MGSGCRVSVLGAWFGPAGVRVKGVRLGAGGGRRLKEEKEKKREGRRHKEEKEKKEGGVSAKKEKERERKREKLTGLI